MSSLYQHVQHHHRISLQSFTGSSALEREGHCGDFHSGAKEKKKSQDQHLAKDTPSVFLVWVQIEGVQ